MRKICTSRYNLDRSRTCMVGDRLNTDILMGLNGKLKTLLVFTGVTKPEELKTSTIQPHYCAETFGKLYELYQNKKE